MVPVWRHNNEGLPGRLRPEAMSGVYFSTGPGATCLKNRIPIPAPPGLGMLPLPGRNRLLLDYFADNLEFVFE